MRRGNKPKFFITKEMKVGLVSLGSDFTAEHEWGIQPIKDAFGIKDELSIHGLEKRRVQIVPENLFQINENGRSGFALLRNWSKKEQKKLGIRAEENSELRRWGNETLVAAWDEASFAVLSSSEEEIRSLREIFEAIQEKNAYIRFGKGHGFLDNPGLVIGIANRLSAEELKLWEDADRDYEQLRKDFDATGIKELLKEKGKGYHALSPKRAKDGSLIFWLNPMEQHANNYGWMTLQDLQDWAEGKGKIPKK